MNSWLPNPKKLLRLPVEYTIPHSVAVLYPNNLQQPFICPIEQFGCKTRFPSSPGFGQNKLLKNKKR